MIMNQLMGRVRPFKEHQWETLVRLDTGNSEPRQIIRNQHTVYVPIDAHCRVRTLGCASI